MDPTFPTLAQRAQRALLAPLARPGTDAVSTAASGSPGPRRTGLAALAREGVWLVVYGLVAIVLTWPLARDLGTHLADTVFVCKYDLKLIAWTLAWQTHALTQSPASFFDANIYHPVPNALLYSETAYGALPFFLPLMLATGNAVLSVNALFIASVAVFAWGLHVLVARATASDAAGTVAAATVLTSPWLMRLWAPAAPNYAVLLWCPALIALSAAPVLSRRRAAALGAITFLQGAVSPYVAASVLAPLGVLGLWRGLQRSRDLAAWRLAFAVIAAAVLLAGLYAPSAWLRTVEPRLGTQSLWASNAHLPVKAASWFLFDGSVPSAVAIPLVALVLVSSVVRVLGRGDAREVVDRLWRQGLLWTLTALLLSTIAGVSIGGTLLPSPLTPLVSIVPVLDLFRVPGRLALAALPGIAVLSGVALWDTSRWAVSACHGHAPRSVRAIVGGLVVVACMATGAAPAFWPKTAPWAERLRRVLDLGLPQMPIDPFTTARALPPESELDARLRAIDGPLLVVDLGRDRDQVASTASAMLASVGAWYPLVNGYGGYYPAAYPELMRLRRLLPDLRALRELQRRTGVEWILVRGSRDDPHMAPWLALRARDREQALRLVTRAADGMLFAVEPDPGGAAREPAGG